MIMDQGVAKMRPVEGGLEVRPHQTVKLAPGGYHLMLMDLNGSFVDGELVPGTLQFENAGPVPVEFEAQPVGAQPPASHSRTH
jgi:copper(I)-binding protein